MFGKLLHSDRSRAHKRSWRCAPGQRIYAIGDVHGRDDLLGDLLSQIEADNKVRPETHAVLIFLGDLIDRGAASRQVVERAMALTDDPFHCVFLRGNHEQLLLDVLDGNREAAQMFHRVGGRATLLSYGVEPADYDSWDYDELPARIAAVIPASHVEFIRQSGVSYRSGDYLFVHAGIRPDVPLASQRAEDMIWIRRDFTQSQYDHGVMVIHGHSIRSSVEIRPNRIGIDTGAYASGVLTAIAIEEDRYWFLSTQDD